VTLKATRAAAPRLASRHFREVRIFINDGLSVLNVMLSAKGGQSTLQTLTAPNTRPLKTTVVG
jgi:hypothetical protein